MAVENEAGKIALGLVLDTEPLEEQAPKVEKIAEKVGESIGDAVDKGSSESLKKSSDKITRTAERTGKESGQRFTAGFKKSIDAGTGGVLSSAMKLAGKLAAIFAAKKIFDFGKEAIEAGSDLAEVQNVVDSTFTSLNRKVDEFAQNAATQFGLSETMAKRYVGTFGAMSKAFGFSEQKAYDMSTALTGLAGDVASFYNITQDEAYTKLKSVFTGETESLKDLGVVMTQTALDDYAMRQGLSKTVQQMTEAEKVTLRYSFVMDQLSTASGDFARTSDGWANQVRILTLQFQSLKGAIGQGLIAALNPVIHALNRFMSVLVKAANVFSAFMQKLFGVKAAADLMGDAVSGAIDNITGGTADAINGIDGVGNATSGAAKKATKAVQQLKRTLEGFDQITKVKETADNAAGAGGSGGGAGGGISGSDVGAMEDYAAATNAAGESMSWLDAIVERFKAKLGPAKEALGRLREQLEKLGGHLGEGLKWLYDNVLVPLADWTITEVVPRFFDTLTETLRIFDDVLMILKPAWKWFWEKMLKPLAKWVADVTLKQWDNIIKTLGELADWFEKNSEKIQSVGKKVAKSIKGNVEKVRKKFADIKKKIGDFAEKVNEKFEAIKDTVKSVKEFLEDLPSKVSVDAAIKLVKKGWETVSDWVKKSIGAKVEKGISLIKSGWETVFEWVKKSSGDAVEKGVKLVKSGFDTVFEWVKKSSGDTVEKGVKLVKSNFDTVFEWVKKSSGDAVEKGVKLIKSSWDTVKAWVEKAIGSGAVEKGVKLVKSGFNTVKTWVEERIGGAVQKLIGLKKDGWNSVATWIKERLGGAVSVGISLFRDGWDTVKGFVNRFESGGRIGRSGNVRRFESGGKITSSSATWFDNLPHYEAGTAKAHGTAFIAGENGPEIVGNVNGSTEVLNKSQIAASVSSGVMRAIIGARMYNADAYIPRILDVSNGIRQDIAPIVQMAKNAEAAQSNGSIAEMVSILKQILRLLETLDFDVKIDGKSLKDHIVRLINANTQATGICEIIV